MTELKRSVGMLTMMALTVTSLIGTGLFLGPSIAAKYAPGFSIVSWVLLALLSIYLAMCFAELVSMYPVAGGIYEFARHAYGRFPAFIIGWVTWIVGNVTTALLIVAALDYGITDDFSVPLFPHMEAGLFKIFLAVLIILVLNFITYRGIEASAVVLNIFAAIGILTIVATIIPGLFQAEWANVFATNADVGLFPGLVMVILALFFILESYFGWESSTFLAEETKNPERVIPKALVWATILITVLGTLFVMVTLGVLGQETLVSASLPVNALGARLFPGALASVMHVAVFLCLVGSAAGAIISTPRLLVALARDKLFLDSLADIHPRFKTPHKAIFFQTLISLIILFIVFAEYQGILKLLVPLSLAMYLSVLIAVPVLRIKEPTMTRHYKAPLAGVLPFVIAGLYVLVILLWALNSTGALSKLQFLLGFILLCVPIYFLLMFYYDPDFIKGFHNQFARSFLRIERLLLPVKVKAKILDHLQDVARKKVLEYGCGVGTLTMTLAFKVGPEGHVFATDLSQQAITIAQKRINNLGFDNVTLIHDTHQVNRVHHAVPRVDAIVSVGMLGYMQDIARILKHMADLLPDNGRIIFVEYTDLFKILPKVNWLNHPERLVEIFRDAGFAIKIEKVRGPFWNFLLVYGIKTREDVPFV